MDKPPCRLTVLWSFCKVPRAGRSLSFSALARDAARAWPLARGVALALRKGGGTCSGRKNLSIQFEDSKTCNYAVFQCS